jgi:glycosyltransferase involved in cell wall biosynthesis
VNVDWFFISHRLPIALGAIELGYEVHLVCGDTGRLGELERFGLIVHPLTIVRGEAGIGSSLKTFLEILSLFKHVQPDIVHLVTIKPVLFGGMAARLLGVESVVAAVSGLGFIFVNSGVKARLRRMVVGLLYRLALGKKNLKVIFQNPDDRDRLCSLAGIQKDKTEMIRGSGVDLSKYPETVAPSGVPVVVLVARLLNDKGVMEFVEAAKQLKYQGYHARFCLVGDIDPDNPASLTVDDLASIEASGNVELWGYRTDIPSVLGSATIVALPSYREGLPKVLLEAAACGRAVVTTDVPGCRDAIESGVTGLLVPSRDAAELAKAIALLLDNPARCAAIGLAGRRLAESEFDVSKVVERHLRIYARLEASAT